MEYKDAKQEFIRVWGELGSSWGINKTMAQIHALLLSSSEALTTEDIMEQLSISRGNVNMNVRALLDWGLAQKAYKPGERKEFFESDKDIWNITRQVASERKKRELDPLKRTVDNMVLMNATTEEEKEFKKTLQDLQSYTNSADKLLDKFTRSDKNWFYKILMKLI